MACYRKGCHLWYHSPRFNSPLVQGRLEVLLELRVKLNDVQNLKKLKEQIRAVDFSEYKDQNKANWKEIGVDDESSDSEADFENDVGPSKNTRAVIIESDEKNYIEVYFRSVCLSFLNLHLQGLHVR